ncbi:unnamed protein product, partial [Adineta steineri]
TLNRFQEAQRTGARKEKESLDRARAISFRQQGMSDSPFADNFVPTPTYDQIQQQAVLPIEQEVDMRSLRERDEQLRELETNIVEVNELFKDVAKLVHEQGGVIDSIDQHIINTEVNVTHECCSTKKGHISYSFTCCPCYYYTCFGFNIEKVIHSDGDNALELPPNVSYVLS